MPRIPEETIARIRDNADILDVVSGYVRLQRRGRNHFGLCPFHQEKTPSFSVNQEKQIFHCFGCGRGGSAINFIMEVEKLDFVDAVVKLGSLVGVPVELGAPTDPRKKAVVQQIFDINELAAEFYTARLKAAGGAKVRAYLKERGLTGATLALFRIGNAADEWEALIHHVAPKKFSQEALTTCGLFMDGQRGLYDRFRGRIMFPIANKTGRVVALAGRIFEKDDPAKYVNSPETPIYHKSEVLYGLSVTRDQIRDQGAAVIVEGYLDLMQLHQADIRNIVAASGTALTDQHARELRKLTSEVFLAYDGDQAGITAAIRGGYTLLRNGLNPRIVELPQGLDPDDLVKKQGGEAFVALQAQAVPVLEFHLKHFAGGVASPQAMRRFLDESLREAGRVRDGLTRDLIIKQLSEITGVDERRLREAMQAVLRPKSASEKSASKSTGATFNRSQKAQASLLGLAFGDDPKVRILLDAELTADLFTEPVLVNLWEQVAKVWSQGERLDPAVLMERLGSDRERQWLSRIIMRADEMHNPLMEAVDCLVILHSDPLRERISALRRDIRAAEKKGGPPPMDLLQEVARQRNELKEIGQRYDKYRQR